MMCTYYGVLYSGSQQGAPGLDGSLAEYESVSEKDKNFSKHSKVRWQGNGQFQQARPSVSLESVPEAL